MKIRKFSTLVVVLIATACAQQETEQSTENKPTENDSTNSVGNPELVDTALVDTNHVTELKKQNQVTDYAEYFLQVKIVRSSDQLQTDNGIYHYYETLDIANGFARITGAYEGSDEFVIWRMSDGSDLVGHTSTSCGPVCSYHTVFYQCKDGKDEDVTGTILPWKEMEKHLAAVNEKVKAKYDLESDEPQFMFQLPQKGTDMDVWYSNNLNDFEFIMMTLSWDKQKFSVKKKYDEVP